MNKKNLLIFFGEYRTFSLIYKQLFDLDKVDIVFSTWGSGYNHFTANGDVYKLEREEVDLINKKIPHMKLLLSDEMDFNSKKTFPLQNSSKMYYHWIHAINSIDNGEKYDKVLLHRCDMISNWHEILNQQWEADTLYVSIGDKIKIDEFWVNDYYFGGDFKTVKKFVNLFKNDNDCMSHFNIGNKILNHNFKWKELILKTILIRKHSMNIIEYCNENNIKLIKKNNLSKYIIEFISNNNNNFNQYKDKG